MNSRPRIAFVKEHGFHVGGTELNLQRFAAYLDKKKYQADYYSQWPTIDSQVEFLSDHHVNVYVGFNMKGPITCDLVLGVAGDTWPIRTLRPVPLVEQVALARPGNPLGRKPDWSTHSSPWQMKQWIKGGGDASKASVAHPPIDRHLTNLNLREELGIEPDAIVAGLLQRNDDAIYSHWPLDAYARCAGPNRYFLIMNGSQRYKEQAEQLPNVKFIPDGDDLLVCKFFNTLDFFAHGRAGGETYGGVIAEAMTHGLPVLTHVARYNGHKETMAGAGYFCFFPWTYRSSMEALYANSDLRFNFSVAASLKAVSYSRQASMTELERIFDSLLKEKHEAIIC